MNDHKMAGAVAGNFIVELAAKALMKIEPALAPLLVVGQILVAVGTIVWIYFRIRGARLDNKIKEAQLKDVEEQ
jgi:uncharacterized membrane protein YciS (DUF1049 family)